MSTSNYGSGQSEPSSSRFGEVAKGGADLFRRAFSVAAREELNQARQETMQRLTPVAQSSGMMVAGGVMAGYGTIYIVQGLVRLLATRMPPWLAYLLTGAAIAGGGAFLLVSGRRQLKEADPTQPEGTQQDSSASASPTM